MTGPEPAIRNARRCPWTVRNGSDGVTSRTGRRLGFRWVMSPTSLSGPGGRSSRIVVVELLFCLLRKESLELRGEFVAAWQIFIPRQQRTILLSRNEGIVLSLH